MSTTTGYPQIIHALKETSRLCVVFAALIVVSGCADQKRQAEGLVRIAIQHSEANRYAEAVQVLDRAVALNPGLAEAFYLRGSCDAKLSQTRKSIEDFSVATRLKPGWDEAWCSLGIAQISSGESSSGIASLTRALLLNPNANKALDARAKAYHKLGRATEELRDLNDLLKTDLENTDALLRRAMLLSKDNPTKATADLSTVIQLERDNANAWMQRGMCYSHTGDADRALADLNIACRLQSSDYHPWLERGRILRALHRFDDAISDLSTAAERGPRQFECCLELGLAFLDAAKIDAAEANVLQAEKLAPTNGEVRLAAVRIEIARGRRTAAIDKLGSLLNDADSISPEVLAAARISLAEQLHNADQPDEALTQVEQALEVSPADSDALRMQADLLAQTDRREEAIESYTRLISIDSSRQHAILHRGKLRLQGQEWDAAAADFTAYLAEAPGDIEALTLRSQSQMGQKQPAGAISDLSLALLKNPDAAELYLLRADAFDQFNEPTAALADLQKAARLLPDNAGVQEKTATRLFQDRQFAKAARLVDTIAAASAGQLSASLRLLRGQARLADGDLNGAREDAIALSGPESAGTALLPKADVQLLLAMIALRRQDDVEALKLMKDVPEDSIGADSLLLYGQALARLGQPDEAIRILTLALKTDPNQLSALVARARVRMESADWQGALDDANTALQHAPGDPQAIQMKGTCLFQNDRFREALDVLDELALMHRDTNEARWIRIQCCSELQLAFREMEELNALLGIAPNHHDARLLRADLLEQLGRFDDSISDLTVVLQHDPANLATLTNRGILNQRRGNAESAIEDFTKAIELSADDAELWYRRGIAHSQMRLLAEAKRDLDKAIQLNPRSADAWYAMGNVDAGQGRVKEAIEAYIRAVEIQPEHAAAWYNRGNLLFSQAKMQQAVDCWSIAIQIQPEMFRAWNNRAAAYDRMGQDQEALADYEKTLELNPGFVRAWDNLAWLLATCDNKKVHDPERAVKVATKACELSDFQDWSCLNTLATCSSEYQDHTAALKWARQAREVSPAEEHAQLDQIIAAYETQLKSKRIATSPGRSLR